MKQAKHEKHTLIFFFQSQESCFRRNPAQSHFRSTPTRFLGTSVPRYPFGSFEIGRAGFEISWRSLVHAQQHGSKRSCTRPGTGRIWENLGNLHGGESGKSAGSASHWGACGRWLLVPCPSSRRQQRRVCDPAARSAVVPVPSPAMDGRPLQCTQARPRSQVAILVHVHATNSCRFVSYQDYHLNRISRCDAPRRLTYLVEQSPQVHAQ